MDVALRALADRTRRQILSMVWNQERPAGEIAAHFSLTRPAVSQHLTVLLESRLVSVRQVGTRRLYQTNRDEIAHLRSELESFWDGRLHRLRPRPNSRRSGKGKRNERG